MDADPTAPLEVGRYILYGVIARGGMATVHFGRLAGARGFSRTVAIKRLHSHLVAEPEFSEVLLDEARMASRIRHANVAQITDVVAHAGELLVVMEYVEGESLAALVRAGPVPVRVAVRILVDALEGLHAAHEATDERGVRVNLVHRDVSPQNVLVGVDGVSRVIDFGVAHAAGRSQTTRKGEVKGKLAYMAPEQLRGIGVDARTDVFSTAVVAWELLSRQRLFTAEDQYATVLKVLEQPITRPSELNPDVPAALEAVVMKGLERSPSRRYSSASEFAAALENALSPAPARDVASWVKTVASESLQRRADELLRIDSGSTVASPELAAEAPSPPAETQIATVSGAKNDRGRRGGARWFGLALTLVAAAVAIALVGLPRWRTAALEASPPDTPLALGATAQKFALPSAKPPPDSPDDPRPTLSAFPAPSAAPRSTSAGKKASPPSSQPKRASKRAVLPAPNTIYDTDDE